MCEPKGYTDIIRFMNYIVEDMIQNKGEQRLHYKFKRWKNSGSFDIINDISEYVTLIQLMGGNCNFFML